MKNFPTTPFFGGGIGPGFFAAVGFFFKRSGVFRFLSFESTSIADFRLVGRSVCPDNLVWVSLLGASRNESSKGDRVCLRDRSEILYGKTCWGSINLGHMFLIR